jgi:hypothetical protein
MTPEELKRLRENLHKSQNKILSPKLDIFIESNSKDENNKKVLEAVKTNKLKFKFLPPLLSYTMQALKEVNNVPEEMAIQAILGTVNFATQNLYNIDPIFFGGSIIPTTEYFIALAPTAGMKSTIYKMLDHGIKRFEEDEKIRYGNEIQHYKLAHAIWLKEYNKLEKQMTTEDLQDKNRFDGLMNSLGPEPQKPTNFKYRLSTGTRNGLIEFLDNVPFGGMSSSEAGEFFNGHTFQDGKNNSKGFEMITTLTNLWDGAPIEKVTGVETKSIQNRRFTMLFLLQKAMAKDWLGNKIYSEQGFVHRLLITHTDYWDVPELDRNRIPQIKNSQNKLKLFHDRIYELLSQKKSFREDSSLELDLPTISMTDEACDKLAQFDNLIKREQTTTYSEWQGFVSRLYEHSVRLAATVAIFEGATSIELRHAECAVELAFFYLEQRISLDLGASTKYANQVSVAEKLAIKIIEKLDEGVTIDKDWLNKKSPMYFRGLAVDERRKIIDEIKSRGEIMFVDLNGKDVAKRVV